MSKKNGHERHHASEGEEHSSLKSAAEIAAAVEFPAAPGMSPKELEELRAQAAKAQENWDRFLRAQADLDNYRKRVARERQELIKAANEKLLSELLPPLDHFEMGLQSAQSQATNANDALRQGMELVLSQFQQFLKSQGVVEIQSVGQKFDPSLHEAIAQQPSDEPEGQVIQQVRKGYRLNDKLLRAASVIVSKSKEAPDGEESLSESASG